MAPFVIPGIVLAIGFYAAYAPPPFALYGTAAILVLAYTTWLLLIAYVNCLAGLRAIHPEMEDAVRILGGNGIVALVRVVAPLMNKGLVGSWILVFIPAVRERVPPLLPRRRQHTRDLSMLLDLSEDGNFETLAALGCVLSRCYDPDRGGELSNARSRSASEGRTMVASETLAVPTAAESPPQTQLPRLVLRELTCAFRNRRRRRSGEPRYRPGRVRFAARSFGVRQDRPRAIAGFIEPTSAQLKTMARSSRRRARPSRPSGAVCR